MKTRKELKTSAREKIGKYQQQSLIFYYVWSAILCGGIYLTYVLTSYGTLGWQYFSWRWPIILVATVVMIPFLAVVDAYALGLVQGEERGLKTLLWGWRPSNWWRIIVIFVPEVVAMIAAGFVIVDGGWWLAASVVDVGDNWIEALFMVALISVVLIVIVSVASILIHALFAPVRLLLASDEEITGLEAVRLSAKMMKGHVWECFWLVMSFAGWAVMMALASGMLAAAFEQFDAGDDWEIACAVAIWLTLAPFLRYVAVTRAAYFVELVGERVRGERKK